MIFETTAIDGVWRVLRQEHRDERGFFARTFCADEFAARGLQSTFEQSSISGNTLSGTLRGMHFQRAPYAEAKFIRCVSGAIFDVALDLRPGSATRGKWVSEILSAENGLGFYISPGLAHGFQTLVNDSSVLYQITPPYQPGYGARVRWNDPAFAIKWPVESPILSAEDANCPDWQP